MEKAKKVQYREPEGLRRLLVGLKGQKYRLDCGHHVTFGHSLGNDVTILNGKAPKIVCSLCSR